MRILCTAACLALCSTGALAAEFGIGVSARSDDGTVYVPIDISKSFRLEPSVRYASTSDEQYPSFQESDALEVGVGVFGLKQIGEAAHLYYGARLAYVDLESSSVYIGNSTTNFDDTKLDGYRIGPTLGFEYLFGKHFSVGGEASYTFVDLEGTNVDRDNFLGNPSSWRKYDVSEETSGTQTRLIFRYMF